MRTQEQGSGAGLRNVLNSAAFTFKEETDLETPVSRATEVLLRKVPRPCREGWVQAWLCPGPRRSSRLQAGAAGVWGCRGARPPAPPRPAPAGPHAATRPSPQLLSALSVISLLEAARSFRFGLTVSGRRHCTTVHKPASETSRWPSFPRRFPSALTLRTTCHLPLLSDWSRKTGHLLLLLEGSLLSTHQTARLTKPLWTQPRGQAGINALLETPLPRQ